jgi:hypothetical protein
VKKLVLIVATMLLTSTICYCDNSVRIKELSDEGQKLIEKRGQAVQVIEQINVRVAQIQGAIDELSRQDKPKNEKEGKDGKTKKAVREVRSSRKG